jgi:hypothetical protein
MMAYCAAVDFGQKEESSLIGRDLLIFLLFQSRDTADVCSVSERVDVSDANMWLMVNPAIP